MRRSLFTSRIGGFSRSPYESFNLAIHVGDDVDSVLRNRELLASAMGLQAAQLFFMTQVHGNKVYVVDEESDSSVAPEADALFTTRSDVALVTLVADCIPLLLKSESAVAAVHVGRRGLVARVFDSTLKLFTEHGITPDDIVAEIGPSICAHCYEVDEVVYQEVITLVPHSSSEFRTLNNKPCLDLPRGLQSQLDEAGIKWSSSNQCTCHDENYFSYRRSGVTGRQAGIVSRTPFPWRPEQSIEQSDVVAHG